MFKYLMVAHNQCICGRCYPDRSNMHDFEAPTDEKALEVAETWWHDQLPLHVSQYSLARILEVKTTSKARAMSAEFSKPSSYS